MSAAGDRELPIADTDGEHAEPAPGLTLLIVHEGGDWGAFGGCHAAVERAAAAFARHPACRQAPGSEASLVLSSDTGVQRLNRTYRGKDATTNVLSFPYQRPAGAGGDRYLGDIILAAETITQEAAERGIERGAHLQHLVVHGLLHLIGHDHQSNAEADAMEALETEILAAVGVGDPYAADSTDDCQHTG